MCLCLAPSFCVVLARLVVSCACSPDGFASFPRHRNCAGRGTNGWSRLRDFETDRLAHELFERLQVTAGRPHLELRIAARMQRQRDVFAAVAHLEAGDRLGMAAIEAFGDAQDRREGAHGFPERLPGSRAYSSCDRRGVPRR